MTRAAVSSYHSRPSPRHTYMVRFKRSPNHRATLHARIGWPCCRSVQASRAPNIQTWRALPSARLPLLSRRTSVRAIAFIILIAVSGGIASKQSPAMRLRSFSATRRAEKKSMSIASVYVDPLHPVCRRYLTRPSASPQHSSSRDGSAARRRCNFHLRHDGIALGSTAVKKHVCRPSRTPILPATRLFSDIDL